MAEEKAIPTPAQIVPYVEVLGEEGTVDFLIEFGGAELYLARNPKSGKLAKLVGRDKAAKLAIKAEHLPARVPLMKNWCACVLYRQGLPVAQIARKVRVSDVTVRAYVKQAGLPKDSRQLPLF